ncbi:hypothetical protein C1C97_005025 [Kocuria tytonis]|uniref:Integral membrane protein n=1 Tax=Kocuria tytonis TaxID=2054280 RepID=A0A495ABC8_9MICC|nr:hypothetical protein C1C97_005025 [Kocuria tytonis]
MRGWAAAAVCTLCAATSHYAMDPAPPDPLLLGLVLALAGLVCVLLAGRRRGAVRTGLAVLLSQLPFHLLFAVGGHSAAAAPGTLARGHGHHAHAVQSMAEQGAGAVAHDPGFTAGLHCGAAVTAPMLWAHVAAAAVTFVLIRHAEDGWWRLLAAAVQVFFTAVELLRPVLVPSRRLRPVPRAYLLPPRTWSPVRVISRRGPPALSS